MILHFTNTPCLHLQTQTFADNNRGYKNFLGKYLKIFKQQLNKKITGWLVSLRDFCFYQKKPFLISSLEIR